MTLIADAVSFARFQLPRVYDLLIAGHQSLAMSLDMLVTRTVATFASDGQLLERLRGIVTTRLVIKEVDITCVAGETGFGQRTFESLVAGWLVAGRQIPRLILDIPGDGRLEEEFVFLCDIGTSTGSGADHEVDRDRLIVDILAIGIDHFFMMVQLILKGRVRIARRVGIFYERNSVTSTPTDKRCVLLVIFNDGCVRWPTQRVSHGMMLVGLVDIRMAFGTTVTADKRPVIGCVGSLLVPVSRE